MSKPFFIWTMRRTGGTSLTSLLSNISEYRGMQHEPFNVDRVWGNFVTEYRQNKSIPLIKDELNNVLKTTPLIKHCYELFGIEFNNLILDVVKEKEYKHILLIKKNELSRICSLFLAKQTSVWGLEQKKEKYINIITKKHRLEPFDMEEMHTHIKWCKNISKQIINTLTLNNIEYKIIYFEELYTGTREERLASLYELFEYLEFSEDTKVLHEEEIEKKIFNNSQDSIDILSSVPNYKEIITRFNSSV